MDVGYPSISRWWTNGRQAQAKRWKVGMTDQARKKRLGDFEIIRELGRGGMGIVYEARQRSLNRKVALKVLSSSLGMTAKAVIRLRREAETAAKLHHTNLAPMIADVADMAWVQASTRGKKQ